VSHLTPPPAPVPPSTPRGIPTVAMFAGNLLLALVWVAMSGHFEVVNLLLGFVLGYVVLYLLQRVVGSSAYFRKSWLLLRFVGFYALEVVRTNVRVAVDVVAPTSRARPGVVAVPLDARTDVEITLLANLITMTPGSLSIDVADDRSVIYVHSMFLDDPEALRRTIKDDLERRVLELLR
jgi:multicomponent Na+:H+ antiporter subunit E